MKTTVQSWWIQEGWWLFSGWSVIWIMLFAAHTFSAPALRGLRHSSHKSKLQWDEQACLYSYRQFVYLNDDNSSIDDDNDDNSWCSCIRRIEVLISISDHSPPLIVLQHFANAFQIRCKYSAHIKYCPIAVQTLVYNLLLTCLAMTAQWIVDKKATAMD